MGKRSFTAETADEKAVYAKWKETAGARTGKLRLFNLRSDGQKASILLQDQFGETVAEAQHQ